jgi:L-fuconolactonase
MEIVDAHVHFVGPPGSPLAWNAPNDALLNQQRLPGELRAVAARLGVVAAIAIEADPRAENLPALLALGAHDPTVAGVVANLQPGNPGFLDRLTRAAKNPLFRGIRVGAPWAPIEIENPEFLADLEAVGGLGFAVDVVTVGGGGIELLDVVTTLTRRLTDLRVVIDHLPFAVGNDAQAQAGYRSKLRELGANPRVYAKLSNLLPRGGPVSENPDDYRPVVEELFAAFGPDRLMYGSNWPVSLRVAPYERALEILLACVPRLGADAAEKFFHANARTAYRIGPNPHPPE